VVLDIDQIILFRDNDLAVSAFEITTLSLTTYEETRLHPFPVLEVIKMAGTVTLCIKSMRGTINPMDGELLLMAEQPKRRSIGASESTQGHAIDFAVFLRDDRRHHAHAQCLRCVLPEKINRRQI
jgi:hypothetical protein